MRTGENLSSSKDFGQHSIFYRNMDKSFSITLLGLIGILLNQCLISANSTRGIPLSRAALYNPGKDFVCLDGTKMMTFAFVNDDYCDCPDGSDEPGTAACPNGRFFCVNAGHISSYIPSSRVNDGICDCCDGSDEDGGETDCLNTCNELGRVAREEAERASRLAKDGYKKRLEMSQEGKKTRQSKEDERSRLEAERKDAEGIKEEKLKLKEEAERPEKEALEKYQKTEDERKQREDLEEKENEMKEAEDVFRLIDSNNDGKITVDEIQVRQTFDRNKDGEVSIEEATFFLNLEMEMSKEDFLKDGWLLAKPYFLMEKGMFAPPPLEDTSDEKTEEVIHPPADPSHDVEIEHPTDYEDDEAEETMDPEEEKEEPLSTHEELESKPKYDEATMALINVADKARSEYETADQTLRDISHKLQELNDALNIDFTEDERFSPLHGQCFDFEDREYVYTLCPFKDANQKGKNGGGSISLGRWGSWSGGDDNKYSQMLYDRGQSCWNGPARSARVFISCGLENRLSSVSEPSRCEYRFDFTSPSACINPESLMSHDEL